MNTYRFGEVVEINGLTSNQLKRWTQIGLIVPTGTGSPDAGWRRYTIRNVIEARICDRLRQLHVDEALLHAVVKALNRTWDGEAMVLVADQDYPKPASEVPVFHLSISLQQVSFPPDTTVHETYLLQIVDPARLSTIFAEDDSGIFISVSKIVADVERQTGDVLDFAALVRKKLAEALAKDERHE